MNVSRTLFAALLASASLTACVDPGDDAAVDVDTEELSAASWGGTYDFGIDELSYPPTMTVLNGVEVWVIAYDPEGNPNPLADLSHQLYWFRCDTTGACTQPHKIDNHLSKAPVSLAAYNNKVYMLHVGDSDGAAVWESSLDLDAGVWSNDSQVTTMKANGTAPGLAVFDGRLYAVGSTETTTARRGVEITTFPMWWASAGLDGAFGPTHPIPNSQAPTAVSLAVLGTKLYAAHGDTYSSTLMIQSLPSGSTTWTTPAYIKGSDGGFISGTDVKIASLNGYLHVIHHSYYDSNHTFWTYNRGCDAFAPDVSIDSFTSTSLPSMSAGLNGTLVVNRLVDTSLWPYTDYHWFRTKYFAPPPPQTVPNCGASG